MIAHGSPSCSAASSDRSRSSVGFLQVGVDVDRDVAEEPQRECQREGIVVRLSQRDRLLQHLGGRDVLPQPVAGLAETAERPALANRPGLLRTGQRQRPLVQIDREPTDHAASCPVSGVDQLIDRLVRQPPVARVQVEGSERRELQVLRRERGMVRGEQTVGDDLVEPDTLPLREAPVRHVAQRRMAHPPAMAGDSRLPHQDLGVLEVDQLRGPYVGIDLREFVELEREPEDRGAAGERAEPRGQRVQPGGHDRLHRRGKRPAHLRRRRRRRRATASPWSRR